MIQRTLTVEFPGGETREVAPSYWEFEEDFMAATKVKHPVFAIPGYRVLATVDGRYLALRDN